MLKDCRQNNNRNAFAAHQQKIGCTGPKIGPAFDNFIHGFLSGNGFAQFNVHTGVGIKTFFHGHVIARKLKLVEPFQLNGKRGPGATSLGFCDHRKTRQRKSNSKNDPHQKNVYCMALIIVYTFHTFVHKAMSTTEK